jgi:hypothetical protein
VREDSCLGLVGRSAFQYGVASSPFFVSFDRIGEFSDKWR